MNFGKMEDTRIMNLACTLKSKREGTARILILLLFQCVILDSLKGRVPFSAFRVACNGAGSESGTKLNSLQIDVSF